MIDDTPHYLGIGKVQINEAFLNQVASSRLRLHGGPPGAESHGATQAGAPSEEITPAMREEARAFIAEYFLNGDNDAP